MLAALEYFGQSFYLERPLLYLSAVCWYGGLVLASLSSAAIGLGIDY